MHRFPPLAAFLALVLGGCASLPRGADLPPPPVPHANGGVLWRLTSQQCIPRQRAGTQPPAPCLSVDLARGDARGHVVLKDLVGVAQYLVMPTVPVAGIEDPRLLAPEAPNLFHIAWQARGLMAQRLGATPAREVVSISVNSPYGRTQDHLHLHLDCTAQATVEALRPLAASLGPRWSPSPVSLSGHPYFARWLDDSTLASTDPFRLLARDMPGRGPMAAWTLVLVGASRPDGREGFILLAARADPAANFGASGEELQDHDCRLVPRPG
jgi:CDP-diacylglycerol pyrophosphatase